MEMERIGEFPHNHVDRRPWKRPRHNLDISQHSKDQIGILCGQEVGDVNSLISSTASSHHTCSSLFSKGVARNASPPWREDDKDGHYMFAVGENLTSRCNYLFTNF
ncbi:hypothetical protein ZIOFF_022403 [Zingiber officinale]|uniref:Uncharacterized protein n=1 Tax=Zingiber officinale TaxID=94328 RepID=A0A8J5HCE4_ZINOF|nr:hypothetical protein ZIOFF_022403 [Zingiber officinale]